MKHTLVVKEITGKTTIYRDLELQELSTRVNHLIQCTNGNCTVKRFFKKVTIELR